MASLTNTLLARFGSKVTLPSTGMLMNNGLMWFDPVPERLNSIRAGVRPLANMCPTLAFTPEGGRLALGAAGGRRIMPAIAQLVTFLLRERMPLEEAVRRPRIDASDKTVILDERLPVAVQEALKAYYPVKVVQDSVYPPQFAVPSLAYWKGGEALGVAHAQTPWPAAVGAAEKSRKQDQV